MTPVMQGIIAGASIAILALLVGILIGRMTR